MPIAIPDDDFVTTGPSGSGSGSACCCGPTPDFVCPGCGGVVSAQYLLCVSRIRMDFTSICSASAIFDISPAFCVNGVAGTELGSPVIRFDRGPEVIVIDAFRSITLTISGIIRCGSYGFEADWFFQDTTPGAFCPLIPASGIFTFPATGVYPDCDVDSLLGNYEVDESVAPSVLITDMTLSKV